MERIYDMLILGGGPGGYTAALYAARAGLKTLVLEKLCAGGQMTLTDQIDNYPGFPEGIDGFTLGERMQSSAEQAGAETVLAEVYSVSLDESPKQVHTSEGTFSGHTVVIATGAGPRPLGLPGEDRFTGRGLHYCAACDGMLYRNKTVVVVGGGNSAVGDALQLSRLAKQVILVHRRDKLRATRIYHGALENAPNISFRYESTVSALLGEDHLRAVELTDVRTGETAVLPCDGVFVSIGRVPATGFLGGQLPLDEGGYIRATETTQTAIPGVYAVGDVRTKDLRQILTAAADGAAAVHRAEEYLAEKN